MKPPHYLFIGFRPDLHAWAPSIPSKQGTLKAAYSLPQTTNVRLLGISYTPVFVWNALPARLQSRFTFRVYARQMRVQSARPTSPRLEDCTHLLGHLRSL